MHPFLWLVDWVRENFNFSWEFLLLLSTWDLIGIKLHLCSICKIDNQFTAWVPEHSWNTEFWWVNRILFIVFCVGMSVHQEPPTYCLFWDYLTKQPWLVWNSLCKLKDLLAPALISHMLGLREFATIPSPTLDFETESLTALEFVN